MPELPEVETIASILNNGTDSQPPLAGSVILSAHLLWERTIAEPAPEEFGRQIAGQSIHSVGRRGKFLVFRLSRDMLLIHLRMSGDILVVQRDASHPSHTRLILDLDSGWRVAFSDARKFGRAWLVNDARHILHSLGPEPLDETFTEQDFLSLLQRYRRQLKPLLLDQHFLAGLGNIYTDEALNLAGLHPLMNSSQVVDEQASRLLRSIRAVLKEGILRNGASIDWVYRGGDFQNYFRVYQRTGQPCPECGTPIERLNVGQRGTHFCPHCQVLPN
jgi:formamidopyrimidine-DNA glycosylase